MCKFSRAISQFIIKSKINVFNFTIYDLKSNECKYFVWDEFNGHRGVNELGSCIFWFLNERATQVIKTSFFIPKIVDQNVSKEAQHSFSILTLYEDDNFTVINNIIRKKQRKNNTGQHLRVFEVADYNEGVD